MRVLAILILLCGCGGYDRCEDLQDGIEALKLKFEPCRLPGEQSVLFDINQCRKATVECSDRNDAVFQNWAECWRSQPFCSPAIREFWAEGVLACDNIPVNGLDRACFNSITEQ